MEIRYSYKARDDFKELPREIQKRIAKKMRFYASQENPLKFAERLTDIRESEFRFRKGRYPLFFTITVYFGLTSFQTGAPAVTGTILVRLQV